MINISAPIDVILSAAQEDKYVFFHPANGTLKVEAIGELPDSGRRVQWVRSNDTNHTPNAAERDAHDVFTNEMQNAFGDKISTIAFKNNPMSIQPNARVLKSSEIKEAVLRAKKIQSLYEGIMLPTRLELSAVRQTPQFVACCKELGLTPQDLPAETVDMLLEQSLMQHCADHGPMIDHHTAYSLLADVIKSVSSNP